MLEFEFIKNELTNPLQRNSNLIENEFASGISLFFLKNVNEMYDTILRNWNEVIKDDDIVVIAGDLAFNRNDAKNFIDSANGKKYLVLGNHDDWYDETFVARDLLGATDILKVNTQENTIICCHYPIECWEMMVCGSIMVHSHVHGFPWAKQKDNRYNCGCTLWDYKPIRLVDMINQYGYKKDSHSNLQI